MFNPASLGNQLDNFLEERKTKIAEGLSWFGERFANDARDGGQYGDVTGNLRSSIGYLVHVEGVDFAGDFTGGTLQRPDGIRAAQDLAGGLRSGGESIELVGVAGMEYALAVESRNSAVFTPFIPRESDILGLLKDAGLT